MPDFSNPTVWIGIVLVVVVLFGGPMLNAIKAGITKFSTKPTVDDSDPDVADMLAMKRLIARFNRLNCPEGKAALQTAQAHFFHEAAA